MFRRSLQSVLKRAAAARATGPAAANAVRMYSGQAQQAAGAFFSKSAAIIGAGLALSYGFAPVALAASPSERTFIAIKPDGVHRGLISDIIKRFEQKGYKLVAIKILVPNRDLASSHYAEHDGKPFFPKLVNFLTSGPVVAMVWEGKGVISYGRTMIGATNPLASAPGTIRGDYGIDVGRNIIHGSDSVDSAQREISLWFKPEELAEWTPVTRTWTYE